MSRGIPIGLWFLVLVAVGGCWSEGVEDQFNRAFNLLFDNRYEEAESQFLALARELGNSNRSDAHKLKSKALYHAGQLEHLYLEQPRRAIARLREAIKIHPEAPFAFDAQREIAQIFYDKLMDYRLAAEEIEKLVSSFPDRPEVPQLRYRIAQSFFSLRDFNQARVEARLLLARFGQGPDANAARLLIANSYYVEGKFQEALDAYGDVLDHNPDSETRARCLFERGLCQAELGELLKAENSFLEALKDYPRPEIIHQQLSILRERIAQGDGGVHGASAPPIEPQIAPSLVLKNSATTAGSKKNPAGFPSGTTDIRTVPDLQKPKPKASEDRTPEPAGTATESSP